MTKRCLLTNPVSNANLLARYLADQGVECYAVIEMDKVSQMPTLSSRKRSEFDTSLYQGIFLAQDEVPGPSELPFDAILAGSENGVVLADQLNHRHNLTGNAPSSSALRRHKDAMHQALQMAGLAFIPSRRLDRSQPIAELLETWSHYPCILKPQSSAGGEGVVLCRDSHELEHALHNANWGQYSATWTISDQFVLQPFIAGREYVVDMVAHEGHYAVASVCRYVRCDELGLPGCPFVKKFTFLLDPREASLSNLIDYAKRAASALEIRSGAVHMELLDGHSGPVMIEAAARLHGTIAPALFMHSYAPHLLEQLYLASLSGAESVPSARLIRRGIVSDVISASPGIFQGPPGGLTAWCSNLTSFCGLQLTVDEGAPFERTKDLFSSPLNAAFCHDDDDVLWSDLRRFELMTEQALGGTQIDEETWQRLRSEYHAQCVGTNGFESLLQC